MSASDDELLARAEAARARAYAPYSQYLVGCSVLADGEIFDGANVENASFGLSLCAERIAVARAALEGITEIEAVAIVTQSSPPAAPCGMCLQSIQEFASAHKPVRILLANTRGERVVSTLADLLPHGFSRQALEQGR